ncbi:MAG: 2-hydroxyacyl-CoA dehydratase [Clostridia bacterium]|nr:2-hydroxyacyl-CoA dehydratase [Clostridia bacterium]
MYYGKEVIYLSENKPGKFLNIGIDVGSTTAKILVEDGNNVIYERYERHFSKVREKITELVKNIYPVIEGNKIKCALSGSAGLGIANETGIPFVQEVFATAETVKKFEPDTDVVIELGGEDAKIIFFSGGLDERMNGSCAGGTGAFIDQMASLLDVTPDELDELSLKAERIYPIASRCGVFAKTDIQPLLNQGARKEDVAASIYQAVVNQTISGLAQGRKIAGKVMFLGGPLSFCLGLRKRFTETLSLDKENAIFPDYAKFSVSYGAALYASKQSEYFDFDSLCQKLESSAGRKKVINVEGALFKDQNELEEFKRRHNRADVKRADISEYSGKAYLGIDCGSTTTKLVLISENNELLYSYYNSNKGNPVEIVRSELEKIYSLSEDRIKIACGACTGYGEELIKNAFSIDCGVVETLAHLKAAKFFNPNVDFILDIGGQDIKCFRVKNGAIDSIMLNEACSSGCGSFIETFAKSMGYSVSEFSKLGLLAKNPVNLGTRCTVFMNSSVKQAQKDGAEVSDISAGLSLSVVRNAIYKVIRASSASELGENIVVQGGTFLNDAVLKSFEREIGHNVIRPEISGLMGAFGAALYSKMYEKEEGSSIISASELKEFSHKSFSSVCKGCTNGCHLTINVFGNGNRYISGNKCEKGAGTKPVSSESGFNLYEFKRNLIQEIISKPCEHVSRTATVGIPLSLGMYELIPLWYNVFTSLGYNVLVSPFSTRNTYLKGQQTIPSDTACYPAKLMHGHIEELIERGADIIFYPCLSYNTDEKASANHYNCPVVAYYSELLHGNMENLSKVKFLYPYLYINDKSVLSSHLYSSLEKAGEVLRKRDVEKAVNTGLEALDDYMGKVRAQGEKAVEYARANGKTLLVLSGRPYHVDPEIGHGIDKLCTSLGFVTASEDSVWHLAKKRASVHVLNQWTYHSRLYNAAQFVCENDFAQLVQLVSFGCGIDAITTDEVKEILENGGKLYTQIKIDEITNLGAVKIRLRSLIGAIEERRMSGANAGG